MKHGSTISLQTQIGSHLSGQQQVKALQSDQRLKFSAVFWDAQDILFIDYIEKGRTFNRKYYIALLVCLNKKIAHKRTQMNKKKVLFHQDNAPCHKSIAMMAKPRELHLELLSHPPYSPDMAPSGDWLFADLKRMLQGNRFGSSDIGNWGVF